MQVMPCNAWLVPYIHLLIMTIIIALASAAVTPSLETSFSHKKDNFETFFTHKRRLVRKLSF